ncbi:MAG: DUF4835 family protein [Chlorobi bacterium]|nr:DUF4835 family protein [Chlorobiota bacterium]
MLARKSWQGFWRTILSPLGSFFLLFFINLTYAQELNCTISIDATRLSNVDKKIIDNLKEQMTKYLNERQWTEISFEPHERIECAFALRLDRASGNEFSGEMTVQFTRLIYGSDYRSPLFIFRDRYVSFTFTQDEQLVYVDGSYTSELTHMLAFYAYFIIGFVMDTYGPLGGTQFLDKAREIALIASTQLAGSKAWSPTVRSRDNRYWLIDLMLKSEMIEFRKALYIYHRKGMDIMYKNVNEGRQKIFLALQKLVTIKDLEPNNILLRGFLDAKRQELINIFSYAPMSERQEAYKLLVKLDPGNQGDYRKILQR